MQAVRENRHAAAAMIAVVASKPHKTNEKIDCYSLELSNKNCVFVGQFFSFCSKSAFFANPFVACVGHTNTDMDSIGSAIAAVVQSLFLHNLLGILD